MWLSNKRSEGSVLDQEHNERSQFAYNLFWCSGQIFCTGMMKHEKFTWGASIKLLSLDVVFTFLVIKSDAGNIQSPILASFCYFIIFFTFYFIWFLRRRGAGFVYACKIGYITFYFFILALLSYVASISSQDHFTLKFIFLLYFNWWWPI